MIFTPTYNGDAIFGLAVHIVQVPDDAAVSLDAFFGVPGLLALYGNTRGRTFQISGVLFDSDIEAVAGDRDVFLPGTQNSIVGTVATLYDTVGDTWDNVLYLGHFQADPMGPRLAVCDVGGNPEAGYAWPYQCVMRGLE